jgi:hypothetical protein
MKDAKNRRVGTERENLFSDTGVPPVQGAFSVEKIQFR